MCNTTPELLFWCLKVLPLTILGINLPPVVPSDDKVGTLFSNFSSLFIIPWNHIWWCGLIHLTYFSIISLHTQDFIYSYKCTRDNAECDDTSDLDWRGWVVFAILMVRPQFFIQHLVTGNFNSCYMFVISRLRYIDCTPSQRRHQRH